MPRVSIVGVAAIHCYVKDERFFNAGGCAKGQTCAADENENGTKYDHGDLIDGTHNVLKNPAKRYRAAGKRGQSSD
jgi:hypothetical protein